MWQYNSLCHYGVLGMRWGNHRYRDKSGVTVNQGLMSNRQREEYAKNRVKIVGKKQAINDEIAEYDRKSKPQEGIKKTAKVLSIATLASLVLPVSLAAIPPLVIASGATWTTYALSYASRKVAEPSTITRANKNIEAIKRNSGGDS